MTLTEPSAEQMLLSITTPPPTIESAEAERIATREFGVRGRAKALLGERDRNFLLAGSGEQWLLKITNAGESDSVLDLQCQGLRHIERQDPSLPVPRIHSHPSGADWAEVDDADGGACRVRLLSYLPGQQLGDAPDDARLMRSLGETTARLDRALRGFFHPGADHPLAWDLKRAATLAHLAEAIIDARTHDLVLETFERFITRVVPALPGLRAQVIHNDISYHNAVVDPQRPWAVSGIFDFADMVHAPLIQELAVAAGEVPAARPERLAASTEIVAGYHAVVALEAEELSLLPDLAATRLALSQAMSSWKTEQVERPESADHTDHSRAMLAELRDAGAKMERMYRAACGLGPRR